MTGTQSDDQVRAATLELMQAYQTLIAGGRFDEWIELWADDGICEFPYAPEGQPRRLEGKQAIYHYMTAYPERIAIDAIEEVRVHEMRDPRSLTVELAVRGPAVETGCPYNQRYVIIATTDGAKLTHYREYWNPLVSIDAFGGLDAWVGAASNNPTSPAQGQ